MKTTKKKWPLILGLSLAVLAILAGGFLWYVSDYYPAQDTALAVLAQEDGVTSQENYTVLSPTYPTDTALIFYPGAKVEAAAYLPLLDQLRQTGLTCILVDMPFRLAIFDVNAAQEIRRTFPR